MEEEMINEGRDAQEADNAETVQAIYKDFRNDGKSHEEALEDSNDVLGITNADFYVSDGEES